MAGYLTLHAPFLLEEEIAKLRDKPSKIINNRIQNSLSEIIVKQSCSYMLGGIPYVSVGTDMSAPSTNYGNRVLSRIPPVNPRTNVTLPHDWMVQAYRSFYSELLIEINYQIPKDKQLVGYLTAIPAIYVEAKGRTIVNYSEALKYQLEVWKSENQRTSWDTSDVFGCESISGDLIYFDTGTAGPRLMNLDIKLSGYNNAFGGQVLGNFVDGEPPTGTYRIAIFPNELTIDIPIITINKAPRWANLRKEGGSTTSTSTSVGGTPAPSVTSKPLSGPIKGTAKAGWTVIVNFPEDIVRVVTVDSRGNWSCDYPRPYTTLELAEIVVTQQETSELGLTQTTTTDAIIQRSYGLPILDFIGTNPYSTSIVNLAQAQLETQVANTTLNSFRFVATSSSPRYVVTSIFVGTASRSLYRTFVSRPGSIVQEMGVDLRLDSVVEPSGNIELSPTPSPNTPALVSITAGFEPAITYLKSFSTFWMSEELDEIKNRLKFIYEASYDPITSLLKIRWDENEEVRSITENLRIKWESEPVAWETQEITFWYEEELPEDRTVRDYCTFYWDKALTQQYNNVISYPYLKENSYYTSRVIEVKWEEVLIDPIILQPYYVQLWDTISASYIDCISFNVWGDPDIVASLVETNDIKFLFSNPIKYELIMFDYNLNPYSEVFLTRLEEPLLDVKLKTVPVKYIKLGNYTIKDVNRFNSFSLDVISKTIQLNEYKSYWIPEVLESHSTSFITLKDGKSKALPIKDIFRDDLHEDSVELDLVILDAVECCFTQSSVGSRCSPY